MAKTHIIADSAIREVWYLPKGAAPEEIRLLEVNDRLAGGQASVEALDFGLDVAGKPFRLWGADITTDQLLQLRQDPPRLAPGRSIDGASNWGRTRGMTEQQRLFLVQGRTGFAVFELFRICSCGWCGNGTCPVDHFALPA